MTGKQNRQRGRNPAGGQKSGNHHQSDYTTHSAPEQLRNRSAEQAVLGAVRYAPDVLPTVRQWLEIEDFGYAPHQTVYREMCVLADRHESPDDEVSLLVALQKHDRLDNTAALKVLSDLDSAPSNYANIVSHCRHVLESTLRAARNELAEWNATVWQRDADEDEIAEGSAKAQARIDSIKQRIAGVHHGQALTGVISARDLMAKTFAPPVWIVPDMIAQGLTVMSGKPKMGKSWKLLTLACARANGGRFLSAIDMQPGPVLYLALEDTEESLQERLRIVLQGSPAPEGLTLATSSQISDWHMNMGGLERMGAWLSQHPGGCVIVDTLAKIKPAARGNGNAYAEDYEVGARLKATADANNGAMIVVTHNRKASAEDPLDEINATTGLAGAFDTGIVMRRERGQADAVLYVTGRRIRDAELALRFDPALCLWSLMGDASKYATSKERAEILAAIDELVSAYGRPAKRQAIAESIGKPSTNIGYLLTQMVKAGQILTRDGGYTTPNTPNTTNNPNTPNTPNETVRGAEATVRGWNDTPNTSNVSPFRMTTGFPQSDVSTVRAVRGADTSPACAYPAHRDKWQWVEAQSRYVCGACHWVPDVAPVGVKGGA